MPTEFTAKTSSLKSTHITARNINVKSDVLIDNVSVNDSLSQLNSDVSLIKTSCLTDKALYKTFQDGDTTNIGTVFGFQLGNGNINPGIIESVKLFGTGFSGTDCPTVRLAAQIYYDTDSPTDAKPLEETYFSNNTYTIPSDSNTYVEPTFEFSGLKIPENFYFVRFLAVAGTNTSNPPAACPFNNTEKIRFNIVVRDSQQEFVNDETRVLYTGTYESNKHWLTKTQITYYPLPEPTVTQDEFNRVTSNIVNGAYLEEYSFAVSEAYISSNETDEEAGIRLNVLVDDPVVPRVLSIILGNDVVYVPITYFQNPDGTKGIKITFSDFHVTDLTEIFNGFFSNPDNQIKLVLSKTITVNN